MLKPLTKSKGSARGLARPKKQGGAPDAEPETPEAIARHHLAERNARDRGRRAEQLRAARARVVGTWPAFVAAGVERARTEGASAETLAFIECLATVAAQSIAALDKRGEAALSEQQLAPYGSWLPIFKRGAANDVARCAS